MNLEIYRRTLLTAARGFRSIIVFDRWDLATIAIGIGTWGNFSLWWGIFAVGMVIMFMQVWGDMLDKGIGD